MGLGVDHPPRPVRKQPAEGWLGREQSQRLVMGPAVARGEQDPRLTSKGFVIGIAGYMSPEQAAGSKLDVRSDLYSVASILYEMVTGRRPFASRNYFQLMKAHLNETVAPPKRLRPDMPDQLDRVVLKVLEKDPARRFQTAVEFLGQLKKIRSELGPQAI